VDKIKKSKYSNETLLKNESLHIKSKLTRIIMFLDSNNSVNVLALPETNNRRAIIPMNPNAGQSRLTDEQSDSSPNQNHRSE